MSCSVKTSKQKKIKKLIYIVILFFHQSKYLYKTRNQDKKSRQESNKNATTTNKRPRSLPYQIK